MHGVIDDEELIFELATKASGLFMWARLACDLVEKSLPALDGLRKLLHGEKSLPTLDEMYMGVISGTASDDSTFLVEFFQVLVAAEKPLTSTVVASLMNARVDDVQELVQRLQSLLVLDDTGLLLFTHPTVRELLMDQSRAKEFYIDEQGAHLYLSKQTLRVMSCGLQQDICGVGDQHLLNKDIPDLKDKLESFFDNHPALQYASISWTAHLLHTRSEWEKPFQDAVMKFLQHDFLRWLELVSLADEFPRAIRELERVRRIKVCTDELLQATHLAVLTTLRQSSDAILTQWCDEAFLFAQRNEWVIHQAANEAYHSAMVHTSPASLVRKHYGSSLGIRLPKITHGLEEWSSTLVLRHSAAVTCLVYNVHGNQLATGSADFNVRVWNPEAGFCSWVLTGHRGIVRCLSFDPAGTRLASGSNDSTLR